jgi:isoleucyl-tRNA synthetase
MPFVAENIYQQLIINYKLRTTDDSVHLADWPKFKKIAKTDLKLIEGMKEARKFASLGLEARAKAGIKVRQPLAALRIKNSELRIKNNKELLKILADEINVKKIVFSAKIGGEVELDVSITAELRAEGVARDFVRMVQDLRKKADYTPQDKIYLWIEAPEIIKSAISANLKDFKEKIGVKNIEFKRTDKFDAEEETKFKNQNVWIGIKRI